MSVLTITNLSHIFDEKQLFDNANLTVNNGEHIGVVGLNGAGKSTFMNIIAGNLSQDIGEVKWLNGIRWGYLDQHANIDRSLSVMEYLKTSFQYLYHMESELNALYEKMGDISDEKELDSLIEKTAKMQDRLQNSNFYDLESEIKKVATGLGIHNYGYDTIIATLSGGQRAKLMLAKLLLQDLDVMLLDEPTNFLDLEQIDWLNKFLNAFKGTFILVSHDTQFLNDTCKIIINIENAQITKYWCSYNEYLVQHKQKTQQYIDNYERQQREIKKMEEYIAKNKARASTAGMANSRQKMLDKIDVMQKPVSIVKPTFEFPYVQILTRHLLDVKGLEIGYDGVAILPPIDLSMGSDTKMWIRGTNGLGKTTLLKTLMHKLPAISGIFDFHLQTKINYVEQDLIFRTKQMSATTFMNETFPRMNAKEIRSELAKVGLRGELATKPIANLSGGEQVKIKLCAIMQKPSNLLILDEPTNHLDVNAKDALFDALQDYKGAILFVTHEPEYAKRICTDIFDIKF